MRSLLRNCSVLTCLAVAGLIGVGSSGARAASITTVTNSATFAADIAGDNTFSPSFTPANSGTTLSYGPGAGGLGFVASISVPSTGDSVGQGGSGFSSPTPNPTLAPNNSAPDTVFLSFTGSPIAAGGDFFITGGPGWQVNITATASDSSTATITAQSGSTFAGFLTSPGVTLTSLTFTTVGGTSSGASQLEQDFTLAAPAPDPVSVPELDATACAGAFTALAAGLTMLRGRRRSSRA
jgi:hypothetical protein